MPIFHTQFQGETRDQEGNKAQLEPKIALAVRGPVLQVSLGVSEVMTQELVKKNIAIPEPISGLAMIDTGASVTCIDDGAAQKLGLPVIDVVQMASASHDATDKNVYPALIEFLGTPIKINSERTMGASLEIQGLIVLLGRDVLQRFTIFYNGIAGEMTISL